MVLKHKISDKQHVFFLLCLFCITLASGSERNLASSSTFLKGMPALPAWAAFIVSNSRFARKVTMFSCKAGRRCCSASRGKRACDVDFSGQRGRRERKGERKETKERANGRTMGTEEGGEKVPARKNRSGGRVVSGATCPHRERSTGCQAANVTTPACYTIQKSCKYAPCAG